MGFTCCGLRGGCCWDGERPTAADMRRHQPPRNCPRLPLLLPAAAVPEGGLAASACCASSGVISVIPGSSNWLLLPRPPVLLPALAYSGRPHTLQDGCCCGGCSCCWSDARLLQLLLLPLLSCAEPQTEHLAPPLPSDPCCPGCCCCCCEWQSGAELSGGSGSSTATAAQAAGGLCGATAAARTAEACATWALYCTCSGVGAVAG